MPSLISSRQIAARADGNVRSPVGGALGDTGMVGQDGVLPDGWVALGRCLLEPGGDLLTGRSPDSLAGIVTALMTQQATS